jgi:septal ring-binding cell division protein DamX
VKEEARSGGTDRATEAPGPSKKSPPAPATNPARSERHSEPAPARPATPFKNGAGYLEALRQLDAGDSRGSAQALLALIAAEDPARLTLQIMIACQEETVKAARARAGDGGAFFFVPFTLKGRDCFRVCWGLYPTREAAREAIPTLPEFFRSSGSQPVVLPLARLHPAN